MSKYNPKRQTPRLSDAGSESTNRRSYSPPMLTMLGNVRDLTDGGSGRKAENNPGELNHQRP